MTGEMMRRGIVLGWILGVCGCMGSAPVWCAAQATKETAGAAQAEPKKTESNKTADWMVGVSPARKPADAPLEMKELVGLYRNGERKLILEEFVQVLRLTSGFVPDGSDGPEVAGALEKQPDGKS